MLAWHNALCQANIMFGRFLKQKARLVVHISLWEWYRNEVILIDHQFASFM